MVIIKQVLQLSSSGSRVSIKVSVNDVMTISRYQMPVGQRKGFWEKQIIEAIEDGNHYE
jgi:hypothetical protein